MAQYKHIVVSRTSENVVLIQINRIEARNALNSELVTELQAAVVDLNHTVDVSCVILTGDQTTFIAGADIKEMMGVSVSQAHQIATKMKALHNEIILSPKPFIAAISGFCLGGGLELALACDIRIASPNAKFGFPEINLGIIPGGGGIHRITELVGTSTASQLVLTGEIISAQQAFEWKVVSGVHENVLEHAKQTGDTIASKSKVAIAAAKRLMSEQNLRENELALQKEVHEFSLLFDYPDSLEGMVAFMEKRKPQFIK